MSEKLVIGFMGLAQAGKSTASRVLEDMDVDRIDVLSFARPLGQVASGNHADRRH